MKFRTLGKTRLNVSLLSLGTGGARKLGQSLGMSQSQQTTLVRSALDMGINLIDTSAEYGESETILGHALKEIPRDDYHICTKWPPWLYDRVPNGELAKDPTLLIKSLEHSLKRLQTDYIDIYQLHNPTLDIIENSNAIQTLEKLKAEGKIKEIGISVRSPDDAVIALEKFNFSVIQVNFNMIDQRALDNGLFNLAKNNNTGIIIRTPLVFGYLSSKLNGKEKFENNDHRSNWPKEQLKIWAEAPNLF